MCFAEASGQLSEEHSRTTDLRAEFSISSGTAAKVRLVDGAESHAECHRAAAPIVGGVPARVDVGESPGPSTGIIRS